MTWVMAETFTRWTWQASLLYLRLLFKVVVIFIQADSNPVLKTHLQMLKEEDLFAASNFTNFIFLSQRR